MGKGSAYAPFDFIRKEEDFKYPMGAVVRINETYGDFPDSHKDHGKVGTIRQRDLNLPYPYTIKVEGDEGVFMVTTTEIDLVT